MKFSNTDNSNSVPIQAQFAFPKKHTGINLSVLLIILTILSLLFPLLVQSEEIEARTPIQATEHTAILNLIATNNTATSSDTFTLDINVDPGGQSINAVGIFLGFASSSISALEINTDNSFCDFFIETSINQETGTISIFCGKPYPGIATTSNIAQITFQKDTLASTSLEIKQNSLVLANDGFGTNVLKEINSIDILLN